jgi:hypothetical protein
MSSLSEPQCYRRSATKTVNRATQLSTAQVLTLCVANALTITRPIPVTFLQYRPNARTVTVRITPPTADARSSEPLSSPKSRKEQPASLQNSKNETVADDPYRRHDLLFLALRIQPLLYQGCHSLQPPRPTIHNRNRHSHDLQPFWHHCRHATTHRQRALHIRPNLRSSLR